LKDQKNLSAWLTLLVQVLVQNVPEPQPQNLEERKKWPWWILRKWSAKIFKRLLSRYGKPKTIKDSEERAFAQEFVNRYSDSVLDAFLSILNALKQRQWLSSKLQQIALEYINVSYVLMSSSYRFDFFKDSLLILYIFLYFFLKTSYSFFLY
jgi:hypothetical protein